MDTIIKGSCLCGAVEYRIERAPSVVGDCYCKDCRKSSGTVYCTHAVVAEAAYLVSGQLSFYERAADSGNLVRRGFCPKCGSAIHSTNSSMPGVVFVRVSSMEDPNQAAPQMTVFARSAPHWARLDREKPVFEAMASEAAAQAARDAVSG